MWRTFKVVRVLIGFIVMCLRELHAFVTSYSVQQQLFYNYFVNNRKMSILNVQESVHHDNSIVAYEYRNHIPYGSPRYGNNDEIRIAVPETDNFTLPSESSLYIEGTLRLENDSTKSSATAKLISNPLAFMFSDIRYLMNGVEVDAVRNAGITTTMKGYVSFSASDMGKLENAGWDIRTNKAPILDPKGNFSACVPLKTLLGFAEEYKKIIVNVRQELVLIRSNDDRDVIIQSNELEQVKLTINKLVWQLPHVQVGLKEELRLRKLAASNNEVKMLFKGWEIYEYPSLPQTTKHSWSVKTAAQVETPRYILIAFQRGKKGLITENMSVFNEINLTNITAYLNGKRYPHENLNTDYYENHYAKMYDMYSKFQKVYYNYEEAEPLFSLSQYKLNPLVVIDCKYQNEEIHKSGIEIRIEFMTKENIPTETTAYCVLLHEKIISYYPLSKRVQQFF